LYRFRDITFATYVTARDLEKSFTFNNEVEITTYVPISFMFTDIVVTRYISQIVKVSNNRPKRDR